MGDHDHLRIQISMSVWIVRTDAWNIDPGGQNLVLNRAPSALINKNRRTEVGINQAERERETLFIEAFVVRKNSSFKTENLNVSYLFGHTLIGFRMLYDNLVGCSIFFEIIKDPVIIWDHHVQEV